MILAVAHLSVGLNGTLNVGARDEDEHLGIIN